MLDVDDSVYSMSVVTKTAYWLTDRCYVDIRRSETGSLIVEIRGKNSDCDLEECVGDFCNGLVDFALRAQVAADTADIQNALLQRAFLELIPRRG